MSLLDVPCVSRVLHAASSAGGHIFGGRRGFQVAHSVDEVKDIRDKAQAMAAYARQANDTALVEWATEIKVRAERRAGEMTSEIDGHQGRRTSPHNGEKSKAEILSQLGISTQTASRWEKLAAIPEDRFEQAVAAAKEVAHGAARIRNLIASL